VFWDNPGANQRKKLFVPHFAKMLNASKSIPKVFKTDIKKTSPGCFGTTLGQTNGRNSSFLTSPKMLNASKSTPKVLKKYQKDLAGVFWDNPGANQLEKRDQS